MGEGLRTGSRSVLFEGIDICKVFKFMVDCKVSYFLSSFMIDEKLCDVPMRELIGVERFAISVLVK